ncbi:MAG: hypothetical protein WD336_09835, partial [Trueperaceae bacterium]
DGPAHAATALVRAAVHALEPAYPATRDAAGWSDPNAAWLERRRLLPAGWDEDRLTPEAWAELLRLLQEPYGVTPRTPSGEVDVATLVEEASVALAAGANAVRPLAIVATEPNDRIRVAFVTVIWNWTPHPRLLAYRADGWSLGEDREVGPVLDRIATCAWRPSAWMTTDADSAASYYTGASDAGLRVVGTDRDGTAQRPDRARYDVPDEERIATLRFEVPDLNGARVASLEFVGGGPGVAEVLGLLTSVRTNLGLFDVGHYLAIP